VKLIQKAEEKVKELVGQQTHIKKKLQSLYNSLIGSDSIYDNEARKREKVSRISNLILWRICVYNALLVSPNSSCLIVHVCEYHERNNLTSSLVGSLKHSSTVRIDPSVPVCPFSLSGKCNDKVRIFLCYLYFEFI